MHYFPDPHEGRARREAGDEAWAQRAAGAYEAAVLRSDGDGTECLDGSYRLCWQVEADSRGNAPTSLQRPTSRDGPRDFPLQAGGRHGSL